MLLFLIYRNGYEAKPKSENLICGFGIFSGFVLLMILTSPVFKEITCRAAAPKEGDLLLVTPAEGGTSYADKHSGNAVTGTPLWLVA